MSDKFLGNLDYLTFMLATSKKQKVLLLRAVTKIQTDVLAEAILNILRGRVTVNESKTKLLKKYRLILRKLSNPAISVARRQLVLKKNSHKWAVILDIISEPLTSALVSLKQR